jgi:hypothetical protein
MSGISNDFVVRPYSLAVLGAASSTGGANPGTGALLFALPGLITTTTILIHPRNITVRLLLPALIRIALKPWPTCALLV